MPANPQLPAASVCALPQSGEMSRRQARMIYFALEALNSVAAPIYFNYLFFYMRDHFGFGNEQNFLLTTCHGFCYACSAWYAGRFGAKHGYIFALRLGFAGMGCALVVGALIPRFLGYSHASMVGEFIALIGWTLSMCLTWPTLQSLVSLKESPQTLPRTAGIYNMIWAGSAAVAFLCGGTLFEKIGGEVLFWIAAILHAIQLILMMRLPKNAENIGDAVPTPIRAEVHAPELNPRPIARAKTFLYLGWLANPFAYMAINGILPVIPKLAEHMHLSPAYAGLVCSVWFWTRFGGFVWFYLWPGWHYSFRWLLAAFIALAASFTFILLSMNLVILVLAQIVFGLSVALIYSSSLFYSMDIGASRDKRGGIHEAAIGLGVFAGPAIGATALHLLPGIPNAGILAISTGLFLGLIPFMLIKRRAAEA